MEDEFLDIAKKCLESLGKIDSISSMSLLDKMSSEELYKLGDALDAIGESAQRVSSEISATIHHRKITDGE